MDMSGLNSKTYLARKHLNKIFEKELTDDEISELIFSGKIIKHFSYYKLTETTLRNMGIIPDSVKIEENQFGRIAKTNAFVLKEIQEIFGDCNRDTAKLIAEKYFFRKYNYYYKKDYLNELLMEGKEVLEI